MGQKIGYHVATSGFPGRFDQSWVYDLIWFVPGHGKFEVAMAMESEHFSKLLDSTADVRVWLSCDPSAEAATEYIANYRGATTTSVQEIDKLITELQTLRLRGYVRFTPKRRGLAMFLRVIAS